MARLMGVSPLHLFDADGRNLGELRDGRPDPARPEDAPMSAGIGLDYSTHAKIVSDHARSFMPDAAALTPLVEGREAAFLDISSMTDEAWGEVHYAVVVLPLTDAGARIGFIGMVISTSEVHHVYAEGTTTFGLMFLICSVFLFGVPALGFWLQKRLAERSTNDAAYHARHDPLTGLLNRTAFLSDARMMLETGRVGYAAYIDVDRFKPINDTHGHSVGDALLRHVSRLLPSGPGARAARLGGDEFSVILPQMPHDEAVSLIADLVRASAEEVDISGLTVNTSFSIGVAEPRPGDTLDELLHRADVALYAAKERGRKTAAFYTDEMGERANRRLLLETRLRDAHRDGDFRLHYQPLVDAQTGKTHGYEALLRLNDVDGLPISPDEFVPLAEEIGLIADIGTWVLQNAAVEIAALDDTSSLSVNLSAEQFKSGTLLEAVAVALDTSGLTPERLELEITESVLLEEDTNVKFQIDTLQETGIRIALDDFGTGYSSLSTLWKYGFDRIKIDKSFVRSLNHSPQRMRELIDVIVTLGDRLGMQITAEGVETTAHRDALAALGCDVLQGYYFGKPLPIQDLPPLVKAS
ncbi:MAG: EAL domain-containing protein [Pseudomonadota bacterium]